MKSAWTPNSSPASRIERYNDRPGPGSRPGSVIAIGLATTIVFSALAFGSVEAWAMAVVETMGILLIGLWIVKSILDRRITMSIPTPLLPVAGLLCWGLIQSIALHGAAGERTSLSMDVESSRTAVVSIFFLTVLALAGANFFASKQRLRRLATFLVFYGLALAVFALIQSFTWDGAFYWLRPTKASGFGPFANHDHFAGYMEMLVPFPIGMIAAGSIPAEQRPIFGFAAAMMVIATVASLSRGGILGLAVEGVIILIVARRLRARQKSRSAIETTSKVRTALRVGGIAAMLGAAATLGIAWIGADPIINKATQTLNEIQPNTTNYISRQWIWSDTWAMIKAHPITGAGIGAYETVYPMYSHNNGRMIVAQSHNDYLQVIADCGVIGAVLLVLFLASLCIAMRRALRVADRQITGVALACSAGLIGILVHSLFDFNLQIPSNALLFLFLTVMVSNVPVAAPRRARVEARLEVEREIPVPVLAGV